MKQTRMSRAVGHMTQLVLEGVEYNDALHSTVKEFEMTVMESEVLEFNYDTYVDAKE